MVSYLDIEMVLNLAYYLVEDLACYLAGYLVAKKDTEKASNSG